MIEINSRILKVVRRFESIASDGQVFFGAGEFISLDRKCALTTRVSTYFLVEMKDEGQKRRKFK